ncbi:MAG: HlyD family efflux transporter periplasmic adaptor subunit [Deltaproteobacteria bacterium]|nr:HlyD family efflux transporter periplasmic adaptor subunit [Deltaproteobacteria bacterium]
MDPLHSPSWYRVAELRPRLSPQLRFHRHVYRGESWYVLQNRVTGRVHRLTPAAYSLVSRMDGERTTQQVWDAVVNELGDDAPTQDETIWALGLLYVADVLRCDVSPDTAALFRRVQREEGRERRARWNPIAFRVPLFDPDAFLTRWLPWVGPLFSRAGAVIWCAVILCAAVAAAQHAPELAAASRTLLEPASLVAFWFVYPVVKACHELGHAFAVKRWGGEVHEIGILFLVFLPVPFVDASGASVFPEKHRRMIVGAAGIGVELFLAALGMGVWVVVEPGLVRHVAWALIVIGGTSTLLFNGNPLLRFDGYYVLADALEIPNLASRSRVHLAGLARRHLLGLREPTRQTASGEAPWLVGYAVASFTYQVSVLLGIALFLAGHFFVLGVALAASTLALRVVWPLLKQLAWLLTDPQVGDRRGRALGGAALAAAAVLVAVLIVPVPLRTRAEGVVWLPERSQVRAGAEGFVIEVLAEPYSVVHAGDPLVRTRDPSIEARVRKLEAERDERATRVHALAQSNRVQAEIARERLGEAEASLARARERAGEDLVRSPADGVFVIPDGRDPVGRYLEQGDLVAYVIDLSAASVRVVVPQRDVALLRTQTRHAWVRLEHDLGSVLRARVEREVPAASDRLPSRALGTAGGGPFAVDPADPEGLRTLEPVFQFDLSLPRDTRVPAAGERVYARFDHGSEPVGQRLYRAVRRLLLRQLGV